MQFSAEERSAWLADRLSDPDITPSHDTFIGYSKSLILNTLSKAWPKTDAAYSIAWKVS